MFQTICVRTHAHTHLHTHTPLLLNNEINALRFPPSVQRQRLLVIKHHIVFCNF